MYLKYFKDIFIRNFVSDEMLDLALDVNFCCTGMEETKEIFIISRKNTSNRIYESLKSDSLANGVQLLASSDFSVNSWRIQNI